MSDDPPQIERWDEENDGPFSEEGLRRKLEGLGYRVQRYVYRPGSHFPPHTHEVDKMDAVISGRFRVELGGVTVDLGPGDAVSVPRGSEHTACVVGDDPVESFDGVRG